MSASRVLVQRADGRWGWRLVGDNGSDIIATDGGQGYEDETEARRMADRVVSGYYADADKKIRRR